MLTMTMITLIIGRLRSSILSPWLYVSLGSSISGLRAQIPEKYLNQLGNQSKNGITFSANLTLDSATSLYYTSNLLYDKDNKLYDKCAYRKFCRYKKKLLSKVAAVTPTLQAAHCLKLHTFLKLVVLPLSVALLLTKHAYGCRTPCADSKVYPEIYSDKKMLLVMCALTCLLIHFLPYPFSPSLLPPTKTCYFFIGEGERKESGVVVVIVY